jgi:phosphoribosylformylglycinamidine synthase
VQSLSGGQVPTLDAPAARRLYGALHQAIDARLVRSCHDLSEGGLAACAAEMAFAGGLGARLFLAQVPHAIEPSESPPAELSAEVKDQLHPLSFSPEGTALLLFSESNARLLCEVASDHRVEFERLLAGVPHSVIGEVTAAGRLEVIGLPQAIAGIEPGDPPQVVAPVVLSADIQTLKEAWQAPLRF